MSQAGESVSESATAATTSSNFRRESRCSGRVKWFNARSGYGFITRTDTGEEIFVHHRAIARKNPLHTLRSLGDGEVVEFNVMAADVTGLGGTPVQGDSTMANVSVRSRDFRASGDGRGAVSRIPRWSPIFRSGVERPEE